MSRCGWGVWGTTAFLGLQQGPPSILLSPRDGSDTASEKPSLRVPLPVLPTPRTRGLTFPLWMAELPKDQVPP